MSTGYESLAVCAAAGICDPEVSAGQAYFLAWEIIGVISKELSERTFALQDKKKKAGVEDWYNYGVSPVEFLESKDEKYLAELRQHIGR
jgi:hypothetical protein